ncbi:MAG: FecR domain-containing protein [Bacteroidota bacterium]
MSNSDSHIDKEALLGKWLAKTLTEDELRLLEQEENLEAHRRTAHAAAQWKAPDFDQQKAWAQFAAKTEGLDPPATPVRQFPKWVTWTSAIAAGIALLILSYFLFAPRQVVYETMAGQEKSVDLPDASHIQLNASSEITFERNWKEKETRTVNLKGEGFFKVQKQPQKPFIVQTSAGFVKVLGTSFNVWARDGQMDVQCYTGIVMVSNLDQSVIDTLYPGETFRINQQQTAEGLKAEKGDKPSWTSDRQYMRLPLIRVLKEIEYRFGVEIDTQRISASILAAEINTALEKSKGLAHNLNAALSSKGIKYTIISDRKVELLPPGS